MSQPSLSANQTSSPTTTNGIFPVTGMSCAACAHNLHHQLVHTPGVLNVAVNYAGSSVYIQYDPKVVQPQTMNYEAEKIGYSILFGDDAEARAAALEKAALLQLRKRLIVALALALLVMLLSMAHHWHFAYKNPLLLALSLPVIFNSGIGFYQNALRLLKKGMTNMDSLVALSTAIAFIYSVYGVAAQVLGFQTEPDIYFESATTIIAFILLGKYLEERARRRALSAIQGLTSLQPDTVTIVRGQQPIEVPPAFIQMGDTMQVLAGARIPMDAVVLEGHSMVDESSVNGEPLSTPKSSGAEVYAGTLNLEGPLLLQARKAGPDTLLASVIRMVKEASNSKPPVQRIADTISAIFVPAVLLLAVAVFVLWMVVAHDFQLALKTTISVLIIACPCALGLATPTALIAGLGRAAKYGILFRNATELESLSKVRAILFDKTGTLTQGQAMVDHSWGQPDDASIDALVSLCQLSSHPYAQAVANYYTGRKSVKLDKIAETKGRGISAHYGMDLLIVGNREFLDSHQCTDLPDPGQDFGLFFAINTHCQAAFAFADALRADAKQTIFDLKRQGYELGLLSGDTEQAVSSVAKELNISNYHSRMMPTQKHDLIKSMIQKGNPVAMVGDGINDAAALAIANSGISLASGSDIALHSSGIVLANNKLTAVNKALLISKATMRIVYQNLFWAFFYNLLAIPLAAGALYHATGFLLNPAIAGAAMAFSSVTVVSNSLRLRTLKL